MIRKLTLAIGFGAGYVLGAKAGTERYDQIEAKFRELLGQLAVQDFTSNVSATASAAADKAKSSVNETVSSVGDKVSSSADKVGSAGDTPGFGGDPLGSSGPLPADDIVVDFGAAPGPIVGAAPSSTAPDVI